MTTDNSGFGIEEKRIFVWVLAAVSVAFLLVLLPFAAPILWAGILAVLFQSVNRRLLHWFPKKKNVAAVLTTLVAVIVVVLPVVFILMSVIGQAADWFSKFESGELDFGRYFDKITEALPVVNESLQSFGISPDNLKEQAAGYTTTIANFVTKKSFAIGQNTLAFILNCGLMLYLAFFLLRDGPTILNWMRVAFPLDDERERQLFDKFSEVTRATVKGNLLVGIVQGGLGGLIFWVLGIQPALLWAVIMAVASLIPAFGTALVWAPVAVYLFVIGDYTSAVILVAFGVLVIGLVDNLLRPILVGRDTKLPDYIVLLSTLGGIALFGVHGFVMGPLVAALFFALWNMFVLEFNEDGASRLHLDKDVASWESTQSKDEEQSTD